MASLGKGLMYAGEERKDPLLGVKCILRGNF